MAELRSGKTNLDKVILTVNESDLPEEEVDKFMYTLCHKFLEDTHLFAQTHKFTFK